MKAPVVNWDLRVKFTTKAQAVAAVGLLLAEDVDFNVQFSVELDVSRTLYIVDVDGMPWADNLATAAKILQSVDWKPEGELA